MLALPTWQLLCERCYSPRCVLLWNIQHRQCECVHLLPAVQRGAFYFRRVRFMPSRAELQCEPTHRTNTLQ